MRCVAQARVWVPVAVEVAELVEVLDEVAVPMDDLEILLEGELDGEAVGVRDPLFEEVLETETVPLGEERGLAELDGVCLATEAEAVVDGLADGVEGAEAEPEGDTLVVREVETEAEADLVDRGDGVDDVELEPLDVGGSAEAEALEEGLDDGEEAGLGEPKGDTLDVREADTEVVKEIVGVGEGDDVVELDPLGVCWATEGDALCDGLSVAVEAGEAETDTEAVCERVLTGETVPAGEFVPDTDDSDEAEVETLVFGLGEALVEPVIEGEGRLVMELDGVVVGVRDPLFEEVLETETVPLGEERGLAEPDGVCSATEAEALAEGETDTVPNAEAEVEADPVGDGEETPDADAEGLAATVSVPAGEAVPLTVDKGLAEVLAEPVPETEALREAEPEGVWLGVRDTLVEIVDVAVTKALLAVEEGELDTLGDGSFGEGEELAEPVPEGVPRGEGV